MEIHGGDRAMQGGNMNLYYSAGGNMDIHGGNRYI